MDIASVTVITNEGILADAAATALVVAGLDGWPEVARALNLKQIAVVDEKGTVYLTPEMDKRLQYIGDVEREIIEIHSIPHSSVETIQHEQDPRVEA